MTAPTLIRRLTKTDNRDSFDCGSPSLNEYFKKYVLQDVKRRLAACFILIGNNGEISGYYTLSAYSIPLTDLPYDISRRLRYRTIPAAILGRLAIDKKLHGQGYGKALLFDAVNRTRNADTACRLLLVDALDERAKDFYISFGFETLPHDDMKLFFGL